ncbi:hypothetical protein BN946_scf184759.g23 [Trametes cinnabarina]|uniref:BTB domain-containing protein n=1 Tax=Pycnoporus cinnabarinus TaxID=5643 RepID=A0A060SB17_PYCCI|nr:hypothetical protein BN946_scf184759.g23 [Trametes cinnabarina]
MSAAPSDRSSPPTTNPSSASSPTITNAAYPFNKAAADAILRSSDNVDFWVRRSILAEASCIFEDMLSIPQPPPHALDDHDTKDGLPVIRLTEDSHTLDRLLRLCYPIDDPDFNTLDELRPVLHAAIKYMMEEATSLLRNRLVKLGQSQPLRAFAIACALDLTQEAESLVPLAYTAHCAFVDELKDISAGVYYRVSHYMAKCTSPKHTHSATGAKNARPVSIATSIMEPPPSPKPAPVLPTAESKEPIPPDLLNSPTADVIFRTSDAVDFRLHSALLSLASPVWRRMLDERLTSRPPSPGVKGSTGNGTACYGIVFVQEDSTTLASLLRHVYPLPRPSPPSFSALKSLLIVAHKYELTSLLTFLRSALQTHLSGDALRTTGIDIYWWYMPWPAADAARLCPRTALFCYDIDIDVVAIVVHADLVAPGSIRHAHRLAPSARYCCPPRILAVLLAISPPPSTPLSTTAMSSYAPDDIVPGDIVTVSHTQGRREGLVVGSHIDYAGRQIVEVQLEPGEIYHAWYPTVTRVRRTISYTRPSPQHKRTIERTIYW